MLYCNFYVVVLINSLKYYYSLHCLILSQFESTIKMSSHKSTSETHKLFEAQKSSQASSNPKGLEPEVANRFRVCFNYSVFDFIRQTLRLLFVYPGGGG